MAYSTKEKKNNFTPKKKSEPVIEGKTEIKKDTTKILKTTARLNMRSNPGLDKQILIVIPQGAEVIYYGYHVGDWYYVKYQDKIGFCLNKWLQ